MDNLFHHQGIPRSCDEHWGDIYGTPQNKICPFCYKTLDSDYNSYICYTCKKVWPHDYLDIKDSKKYDFVNKAMLLSSLAKYDKHISFAHLIEEVGEVGSALNNDVTKRKELKEPMRHECVDVINCALELFFKAGGTLDELYEVFENKQKKWEDNLEKIQ